MRPGLRLGQAEGGSPPHHHAPVIEKFPKHLHQGELPGFSPNEGKIDHSEGTLKLSPHVNLPQGNFRVGIPLQLYNDPHSLTVGLIPDITDTVDGLVLGPLGDILDEGGFVHHVGDLGDHHCLFFASSKIFDTRFPPKGDLSSAGTVGIHNTVPSHDLTPCGEIRPRKKLHELSQLHLSVINHVTEGIHHFSQIMRGKVGGHTHGDSRSSVYKKIRHPGGEHQRLLEGVIKIGTPVHGVFINIRQHILSEGMKLSLGIPHGRRGIPVDGTEVTLAVHQHVPHAEILGHAGHGVVNGRISMGMVFTHGLTHHTGGFLKDCRCRSPSSNMA